MPAAERDDAPIADCELGALFSDFPRTGRLILAVSGGADSLALLELARRWRASLTHGPALMVATVDHGLRPDSTADAAHVQRAAAAAGLPCTILTWAGDKPPAGIEEAAREARYGLLRQLAGERRATAVALAHTLDDQAETVLMRLAAGSGPAGLAGMRAREEREGLVLLRPLLGVRKARLVATLRQVGIAWVEDATNIDGRFARARLRGAAAVLGREGLTPERLARFARRMARAEEVVASAARQAHAAVRDPERPGRLAGRVLADLPAEVAIRVLAAEIGMVGEGSQPYGPRLSKLEALWEALAEAIGAGRPLKRTLGGAVISLAADGSLRITPMPPRRSVALRRARNSVSQASVRSPRRSPRPAPAP